MYYRLVAVSVNLISPPRFRAAICRMWVVWIGLFGCFCGHQGASRIWRYFSQWCSAFKCTLQADLRVDNFLSFYHLLKLGWNIFRRIVEHFMQDELTAKVSGRRRRCRCRCRCRQLERTLFALYVLYTNRIFCRSGPYRKRMSFTLTLCLLCRSNDSDKHLNIHFVYSNNRQGTFLDKKVKLFRNAFFVWNKQTEVQVILTSKVACSFFYSSPFSKAS